MKVEGVHYRSIWFEESSGSIKAIDQTLLPHEFSVITLSTLDDVCHAIKSMQVRGAPLIGVTAAFGLYLALKENPDGLHTAAEKLAATRPTAVNLRWALNRVIQELENSQGDALKSALETALQICEEDIQTCSNIGDYGLELLEKINQEKPVNNEVVNILTHCNAGWLATVDWGTALAPVYKAHDAGLPVHVWVDETRPRNQGASLTAWELSRHGVSHTVISDNAGGHLMQQGRVDICLVGSDRTTRFGDVCNKIGTYLKALAAHDNDIPFYVALPVSSIDWEGVEIPIEERDSEELTHIHGLNSQGLPDKLRLTPVESPVLNLGFDVTPGRLVSGLITEQGIFTADEAGLIRLKKTLDDHL